MGLGGAVRGEKEAALQVERTGQLPPQLHFFVWPQIRREVSRRESRATLEAVKVTAFQRVWTHCSAPSPTRCATSGKSLKVSET